MQLLFMLVCHTVAYHLPRTTSTYSPHMHAGIHHMHDNACNSVILPHPVVQVLEEAVQVFGPSGQATATRAAADGMVYTLSVLKEALRRYSVVPVVTRTLKQDDQLEGKTVPAGTMIACLLQVRASLPAYWLLVACFGSRESNFACLLPAVKAAYLFITTCAL